MLRIRMTSVSLVLAVAGALALGGCAASVDPVPAIPDTASFLNANVQPLQGGDAVRIVVFGKDDLSRTYTIGGDGRISLGALGSVRAAGLTAPELEQKIALLLAEHGVDNAQVSVLRD